MLNYYRITDPSDVRDLGEQMAAWPIQEVITILTANPETE